MQHGAGRVEISRVELWFGLLGGGIAWSVHLLAVYALSEFGCVAELGHVRILGISAVAWGVIALSIVLTLVAGAATLMAYRNEQRLRGERPVILDHVDAGDPAVSMSRLGWITSGLFLFIILFETVPVFYFLRDC